MIAVTDRQEKAAADLENAYKKIKVDARRDKPEDICTLAQRAWSHLGYGVPRQSSKIFRLDRGVKRSRCQGDTEAAFLCARRQSVPNANVKTSFAATASSIEALEPACWGDAHQKEATFANNKLRDRFAQAVDEGVLPSDHVDSDMRRLSAERTAKMYENARKRARQEAGCMLRLEGGPLPTKDQLRNMTAYVANPVWATLLIDQLVFASHDGS